MIRWFLYWTWWILWRSIATLAILFTIQRVLAFHQRTVAMTDLVIVSACVILGTKLWRV